MIRAESEHSFVNNLKVERSTAEDDGDDDQVEDLSMGRKSCDASHEKVSPPPSPVSVVSVPNSDAAVPAQTGVIVPLQK